MSWPQIGEYSENGITVRVFKEAYADTPMQTWNFPINKTTYSIDPNKIYRHGETQKKLNFN